MALLNLSICDENKAIIVEAGAIRPHERMSRDTPGVNFRLCSELSLI
jgi:hypothetical protein